MCGILSDVPQNTWHESCNVEELKANELLVLALKKCVEYDICTQLVSGRPGVSQEGSQCFCGMLALLNIKFSINLFSRAYQVFTAKIALSTYLSIVFAMCVHKAIYVTVMYVIGFTK